MFGALLSDKIFWQEPSFLIRIFDSLSLAAGLNWVNHKICDLYEGFLVMGKGIKKSN